MSSASAQQFVKCRTLLLVWLFVGGLNEILVELTRDSVEPTPILWNRLKNHGVAMTPNSDFLAPEAKVFRQAYRLRPALPEQFGGEHLFAPAIYLR
jgi:hypothetical protein